jgi:hypothetical protein
VGFSHLGGAALQRCVKLLLIDVIPSAPKAGEEAAVCGGEATLLFSGIWVAQRFSAALSEEINVDGGFSRRARVNLPKLCHSDRNSER